MKDRHDVGMSPCDIVLWVFGDGSSPEGDNGNERCGMVKRIIRKFGFVKNRFVKNGDAHVVFGGDEGEDRTKIDNIPKSPWFKPVPTRDSLWKRYSFEDTHGVACSIQDSSSVEPHIWLGIDVPEVSILSQKMKGMRPARLVPCDGATETIGWHRYEFDKEVFVHGRMHLDRKMARKLAKMLNYFSKNGRLPQAR